MGNLPAFVLRRLRPELPGIFRAQFHTEAGNMVEQDTNGFDPRACQFRAIGSLQADPSQPGKRQFGLPCGLDQIPVDWLRISPEEFPGKGQGIGLRSDPGEPDLQTPVSILAAAVRLEIVSPPAIGAAGDVIVRQRKIVDIISCQQQAIEQKFDIAGFRQ